MNLFGTNMYSTKKDYHNLCIKEITGNIDESEKQVLNSWLYGSEKNKQVYENLKSIWLGTNPEQIPGLPDIDTEWLKLRSRISITGTKPERSLNKSYSFLTLIFTPKLRPVMAGVVVLLLAASIFLFKKEEAVVPQFKIISSGNEHKEVHLPDGSLVILNNNSIIKYLNYFNANAREVRLSGEAFFSVTKNHHPFTVITNNAKTTVLGTKFNVRAWNDETEVAVREGRVSLAPSRLESQKVILLKNQVSTVIKNQEPEAPREINSNIAGWIDGKFIFNHTPLKNIIEELNSCYNVKINLSGNNLAERTLTGTFYYNSIDSVLTMLCLSLDLDLDKQNEGYVLKSKSISQ